MKIRLAKKKDFNEIMRLYEQLWSPGKIIPENMKKLKKAWHNLIKAKYAYDLVIEEKKRLIGHITVRIIPEFWLYGKTGFIDDVVIDKPYRGKGLAKKLMKETEKMAKKKNIKIMGLHSEDYRPEAIKLYEGLGYKKYDKIFMRKVF
jgi:GNAT superfamily N-acetyltransferase